MFPLNSCQYKDIPIGSRGNGTIDQSFSPILCFQCSHPLAEGNYEMIYKGHAERNNIVCDAFRFVDPLICEKCGYVHNVFFKYCGGSLASELFSSVVMKGAKA